MLNSCQSNSLDVIVKYFEPYLWVRWNSDPQETKVGLRRVGAWSPSSRWPVRSQSLGIPALVVNAHLVAAFSGPFYVRSDMEMVREVMNKIAKL